MSGQSTERCFSISGDHADWSKEDLIKAVEIIAAVAFWMEDHDPGTPVPNWVYLSQPFDRNELMQCWHEWNHERDSDVPIIGTHRTE